MAGPQYGCTLYDTSVAAGGALATGVLDTSPFSSLLLICTNSSGAATRALTMDIVADDGSTVLDNDIAIRTVATSATEKVVISNSAIATGVTAVFAFPPPVKCSFAIAANGAAAVRLTIIGR